MQRTLKRRLGITVYYVTLIRFGGLLPWGPVPQSCEHLLHAFFTT